MKVRFWRAEKKCAVGRATVERRLPAYGALVALKLRETRHRFSAPIREWAGVSTQRATWRSHTDLQSKCCCNMNPTLSRARSSNL